MVPKSEAIDLLLELQRGRHCIVYAGLACYASRHARSIRTRSSAAIPSRIPPSKFIIDTMLPICGRQAGHVAVKRRAHVFLRALMWRNSKADVQDEIGLPPQQERIDRLRFSAVEAHFYRWEQAPLPR